MATNSPNEVPDTAPMPAQTHDKSEGENEAVQRQLSESELSTLAYMVRQRLETEFRRLCWWYGSLLLFVLALLGSLAVYMINDRVDIRLNQKLEEREDWIQEALTDIMSSRRFVVERERAVADRLRKYDKSIEELEPYISELTRLISGKYPFTLLWDCSKTCEEKGLKEQNYERCVRSCMDEALKLRQPAP